MDIRIEKKIPMTAQELYRILGTPEFTAFLTAEYGVKANLEVLDKYSDNSAQNSERDHHEIRWRLDLLVLKKKFEAFGVLRLFHIDKSRCFLILEGSVQLGRLGVGRLLERKVAKRVKIESEQLSRLVTKWKLVNNNGGRSQAGCTA